MGWIVAGNFFVIGLVAWVAAVVLGVGAAFGLWSWRTRWPLAGALAGIGTYGFFAHAEWMTVAFTTATNPSLLGLVAGLFVGCGISVSYGTLFAHGSIVRPRLARGSAEERLWLLDAIDRVRPQTLDWTLTGLLLLPGAALAYLGLHEHLPPAPVVVGFASLLGPLYAGAGLALRAKEGGRLAAELAERDAGAHAEIEGAPDEV